MRNPIQHYAWGTRDTLAQMRGAPVPAPEPEAELWVGAHPKSPSHLVQDGGERSLAEAVEAEPDRFLPEGAERFPFLFKILAIAAPLSLQVHPSREQAEAGFAAEEAAGVPVDAPHRNYRDRGAKPETVIAVSPVRILTGIRPAEQLREIAEALDLRWLAEKAQLDAAALIRAIFDADDAAAARDLQVTVAAARDWAAEHPFDPHHTPAHQEAAGERITALADLVLLLDEAYPGDRGILVATAMSQLFLEPGQSAHTPAGQVHAYVSGTAVEIMEASDNVMRAGLTPKHVDVEQMLAVLVPDQPAPPLRGPEEAAPGVHRYATWDPALSVTRLDLDGQEPLSFRCEGLSALLCTDGEVEVTGPDGVAHRLRGTDSLLHTGTPDDLVLTGAGRLYCASHV